MIFPRELLFLENGCIASLRRNRNGVTSLKYKLSLADNYRGIWFADKIISGLEFAEP